MASRIRPPVSAAFLVVYLLTNLVGPGLHHHAHEAGAAGTRSKSSAEPASFASCDPDDDGHDCAVCIALHQAQTTAVVFQVAAVVARTGEVVPLPAARPALPITGLTRVRGPPSV
jgi:hypothetical protein